MKKLSIKFLPVLLGVLTLAAAACRAAWLEPGFPRVVRQDVTIAGLPPEQDGAVIAVLSDFHFRRPTQVWERIADRIRQENPDLLLLLGDYRDRRIRDFPETEVSAWLARCRGDIPAYGIRGNHDGDLEAKECGDTRQMLAAAGIPLLAGDRVTIQLRGAPLQLCGAGGGDDAWYEMACALENADPDIPIIAMGHSPRLAGSLFAAIPPDLLISGHTHNGQIRLPFLRDVLELVNRVSGMEADHGYYDHPAVPLVVTAGVGMTKLPLRWRNPAELLLLTLRPAER